MIYYWTPESSPFILPLILSPPPFSLSLSCKCNNDVSDDNNNVGNNTMIIIIKIILRDTLLYYAMRLHKHLPILSVLFINFNLLYSTPKSYRTFVLEKSIIQNILVRSSLNINKNTRTIKQKKHIYLTLKENKNVKFNVSNTSFIKFVSFVCSLWSHFLFHFIILFLISLPRWYWNVARINLHLIIETMYIECRRRGTTSGGNVVPIAAKLTLSGSIESHNRKHNRRKIEWIGSGTRLWLQLRQVSSSLARVAEQNRQFFRTIDAMVSILLQTASFHAKGACLVF